MKFDFPKDFLFGAASSACQIESAYLEDGKGEDVTGYYSKIYPEKFAGSHPNDSADFYYKYPEDIKMMQDLGLKCFRFSISWSRIFPNNPDEINQAGIDYYSDVIDKIREAGMKVFFDLWHCDLPMWVIEKGGVVNREFIDWFHKYAEVCFKAFGDRVDFWSTINEPSINIMAAYAYEHQAPFLRDMDLAIKACHVAILAHYDVVRLYKSMNFTGQIGAVIHVEPTYALTMDEKDEKAAERRFAFYSGVWMDPMFKGYYPKILMDYPWYTSKLPEGFEKELADNFIDSDFISINYYSPSFVKYADNGELDYEFVKNQQLPGDDYGFVVYPQGLFDVVNILHKTYPNKDIYITENGIGVKKEGTLDEQLVDDYRINYLREHLHSVSNAIKAGVPVKGYFHWSIIDTWEGYAGGYNFIFGFIQVNYQTRERRPRKSYHYYKEVIKQGSVY